MENFYLMNLITTYLSVMDEPVNPDSIEDTYWEGLSENEMSEDKFIGVLEGFFCAR